MDLLSHLAQLSAYIADKQLCIEEVGLDCIYDSSPLGFEQPLEEKMEHDEHRPTYVSSLIAPKFKNSLFKVLK